ncbi:UDP-3-O-(3-hydroxymyristoyl)glucosamine N-acyltransferase [Ideonella sp. B7]|uniref:UDP-3-O-(3-hydroxymyristoyl)glucosamine N-acyltransferase n=1 Tax=Ideonella benzenivorans TaxID=2831643 RepID=UPI001CED742B|nr:UDP-3-O-(3-hydroxymyristoyl)glucosamine N-acyltransferase [Ideonella benzenivorans]MCA6217549.1 UDP-3-O-(3-hydroxymyristoyl)glucosamine N-acyltransferase [Ideonella benzenivorans]
MNSLPGVAAPVRLADIVQDLGGELIGDGATAICRLASLEAADAASISFLAQAKLKPLLQTTEAACVIVRPEWRDEAAARGAVIVTADPYLYHARLTGWWAKRFRPAPVAGVHPSAVIGEGVQIHPSASVGPLAFIGDGAVIGEGVVIGAQCHVGARAQVGAFTVFAPRAMFGEGCLIGQRGKLQSGAVVGSDGFGFAPSPAGWQKIEQMGIVRIGDDVDIGACTCVDRGALDDTVLGNDVKLDNLIQIAHNVQIGDHTAMAGCVGVAGSARIGARCTFGGAAMISGHLQIADDVHVTAGSLVMASLMKPGHYTGFFPIDENSNWEKNAATLRQLHTLRSRVRALEKKLTP